MFSVTPNTALKNPIMLLASIQSSEWTSPLEQVFCKSHSRWAQEDDLESSLGCMWACLKYTHKKEQTETWRESHLCSDPCLLLYGWPSFHQSHPSPHLPTCPFTAHILLPTPAPSLYTSCNPHLAEMMLDPASITCWLASRLKVAVSYMCKHLSFRPAESTHFFLSASTSLPPKSPEWYHSKPYWPFSQI